MRVYRGRLRACLVAGTAIAACRFAPIPGVAPSDGGIGTDAADAHPDAIADAAMCTTVGSAECIGDTLRTCTVQGQLPTDKSCAWGCLGSTPHCGAILPSGGAVQSSDVSPSGVGPVTLNAVTVNTDTGTISGVTTGFVYRATSSVGIFRFGSLTITNPITVTGGRALAFVADGVIDVQAVIDVRGTCLTQSAGPGGFAGGGKNTSAAGSGGGQGTNSGNNHEGDAGGGNGGTGGSGGNLPTTGGPAFDSLGALVGGGGGGGGAGGNGGGGGGGGGAIQLVSNAMIMFDGIAGISAGGCGGLAGMAAGDGGGGGGAGGTILLEAPTISVLGTLAVNGGGGGGEGNMGTSGSDGSFDRTPAGGGTGAGAGGAGAAGASYDGQPSADNAGNGAGGGGGGIGRIRFNTKTGTVTVDDTKLSPALTDPSSPCTSGVAAVQ